MDPITAGILTATVMPLASGAAGEAGKQVWGSLVAFVRDRFGGGSEADAAALAVTNSPEEVVHGELLGQILANEADQDEQVAVWLRDWLRQAAPLPNQSTVTNTITGDARVRGAVIQAHTISGPITFGSSGGQ